MGNADGYCEHEPKAKKYTKEKWTKANVGLAVIFAEFAACKASGASTDSAEVQALLTKLQAHLITGYYTCIGEIIAKRGKMYVCDEHFGKNINKSARELLNLQRRQ